MTTKARLEEAANRLLESCTTRFPDPEFRVHRDDKGTVWVKRSDGSRSIGLQPWLLRDHPAEEVLDRAERKLGVPAGSHARPE